jgi:hypothetical protein
MVARHITEPMVTVRQNIMGTLCINSPVAVSRLEFAPGHALLWPPIRETLQQLSRRSLLYRHTATELLRMHSLLPSGFGGKTYR